MISSSVLDTGIKKLNAGVTCSITGAGAAQVATKSMTGVAKDVVDVVLEFVVRVQKVSAW